MRIQLILFLSATVFLSGCGSLQLSDPQQEPSPEKETQRQESDPETRDAVETAMLEEEQIRYADFPPDVLFALLSAEIAAQRGRFDVTLANYAQAARDTRDQNVLERAMQIARALNADNAQRQLAELWLEVNPHQPQALRVAAVQAIRAQEFEDAMSYMERLFEQGEEADFENLAGYAQTLPHSDQQELIRLYEELYERHPDEARIGYSLALMKDAMGNNEEALAIIEPILEQHDNFQPAITLKGKLLYDLGRDEEATRYLRQQTRRFPDNRRLGTLYARVLVDQGRLQAAEDEFESLMNRFPEATSLKLSRALVALENENNETARELLQSLVEQGAHTSEAHFYLGRLADEEGEDAKALRHYQQVEAGSHFFSALSRASYLKAEQGELVAARENLDRLRAQMPEQQQQLWLVEINLLLDLRKYDKALTASEKALAAHPNNNDIRYARAMLYERQGRVEEMENDLRAILDEEPDNAIALNALGYSLTVHTERYDEAYELVMRAHELAPNNPAITDSVGWIYYKRGELETALEYLTQAYEAFPDPEIAAHLGQVLWELERRDEARLVLRRALDEADERDELDVLLETIENLGLTPEEL